MGPTEEKLKWGKKGETKAGRVEIVQKERRMGLYGVE